MRQDIFAEPAIEIQRLTNQIQLLVGAQTGHLQRPVAAWIDAGCFVVVPEDARSHGCSIGGDECGARRRASRLLKNVGEAASARQKPVKKRSLRVVNEHLEPIFNAAMAT